MKLSLIIQTALYGVVLFIIALVAPFGSGMYIVSGLGMFNNMWRLLQKGKKYEA